MSLYIVDDFSFKYKKLLDFFCLHILRKVMSHKVNRNKYDAIIMGNFPLFSFRNISLNQTYLSSDTKHEVNAKTPWSKGHQTALSLGRSSWGAGYWGTAAGCSASPCTPCLYLPLSFYKHKLLLLETEEFGIK